MMLLCHIGCRPQGDVVIAEQESAFNRVFVIEDGGGMRRLRFDRGGVDQSAVRLGDPGHLEFAYVRHLTNALALRPEPQRILFIGLGGGTFPMFVRRFLPSVAIDVVEIDPVVVELATAHMGFRTDPNLRVHVTDGRAFLEDSAESWDIVVLDAYGIDNIPYPLVTRPFLEAARARVAPGGLVIANLWGEAVNPLFASMLKTYGRIFDEVHVIAPKGSDSRVVIAFPHREELRSDRLIDAARLLRRRWGFRFDLATEVAEGYLPRSRWPPGGVILEDGAGPKGSGPK